MHSSSAFPVCILAYCVLTTTMWLHDNGILGNYRYSFFPLKSKGSPRCKIHTLFFFCGGGTRWPRGAQPVGRGVGSYRGLRNSSRVSTQCQVWCHRVHGRHPCLNALAFATPFAWKSHLRGWKSAKVEFAASTWVVEVETEAREHTHPTPCAFLSLVPSAWHQGPI